MCSMKLFRAAALLVVAVCLIAGAAAPALGGNIELTPVGDEPSASGTVREKFSSHYGYRATVSCQGLTPGATYYASVSWYETDRWGNTYWSGAYLGDFVAAKNGSGSCVGTFVGNNLMIFSPRWYGVGRSDGPGVLAGQSN